MSKTILNIPAQKTPHFSLSPHIVTWKQDMHALKKKLSPQELEEFLELHAKAQEKPKPILKKLLPFHEQFSEISEINNLLTYLYVRLKKIRKADKLIIDNYRNHPDNFLAKINYGDYCLRKKRFGEIPKLFGETFDPALLYPNRRAFHVSEFRGFMVLMGHYHLKIKQKEAAICFHYMAHVVDPKHPATALLGKKLHKKT